MPVHRCRIPQAEAVSIVDALVDALDVGSAPGTLILYTGDMPATCDDVAATEVATLTLNDEAYQDATFDGTIAYAELTQTPIAGAHCDTATGNANPVTHFRLCDSTGQAHLQGTCSGDEGDDLQLTTYVIQTGAEIEVQSLVVSLPRNAA